MRVLLGAQINGERAVRCADDPLLAWARLRTSKDEVVLVKILHDDRVPLTYDLPVEIVQDGDGYWRIYGPAQGVLREMSPEYENRALRRMLETAMRSTDMLLIFDNESPLAAEMVDGRLVVRPQQEDRHGE